MRKALVTKTGLSRIENGVYIFNYIVKYVIDNVELFTTNFYMLHEDYISYCDMIKEDEWKIIDTALLPPSISIKKYLLN